MPQPTHVREPTAGSTRAPRRGDARRRRHPRRGRRLPTWFAALTMLGLATVCGCDEAITLVEPPDFFDFDRANAWPICNQGAPAPEHGSVPPPPGIRLEACPNPATADDNTILFRIILDVSVPDLFLGIFDDRGVLVRRLVEIPRTVQRGDIIETTWLIEGVPPGDYRAYFRSGRQESNGDLRISP